MSKQRSTSLTRRDKLRHSERSIQNHLLAPCWLTMDRHIQREGKRMSRRTSDAEKVLNGTDRPFRLRGDPHSPPITATPKNPRWMNGRQRDHWRRLAPLLVGTI